MYIHINYYEYLLVCTQYIHNICINILFVTLVCGGIIEADVKGQLAIATSKSTPFCEWEIANTNRTVVLDVDFRINKNEMNCSGSFDSFVLLATDRKHHFNLRTPLNNFSLFFFFYRRGKRTNKNVLPGFGCK